MRHLGAMLLAYVLTCLVAAQQARGAGPELKIGPSGTGPVNKRTPFKFPLIKSLFPEYTVTEGTENWEGDPYPVIYVNDGNERLLTITGATEGVVRRIWTESPRVPSAFGVTVGTAYRQIFHDSPEKKCSSGTENASGTIFCRAPQDKFVTYQFAGKMNGADLPPPRILRTWKAYGIIWSNPDVE